MEITKEPLPVGLELARKVLTTIAPGLSRGVGVRKPGFMCVEAAVCYAMGLPHGDNPPCVCSYVRRFKICLNDLCWPSEQSRAKHFKALAVCQLGSNTIDGVKFYHEVRWLCLKSLMRDVLPQYTQDADVLSALSAFPAEKPEDLDAELFKFVRTIPHNYPVLALHDARWHLIIHDYAISSTAARVSPEALSFLVQFGIAFSNDMFGKWRTKYLHDFKVAFIKAGVDALRVCGSPGVKLWDTLVANGEV